MTKLSLKQVLKSTLVVSMLAGAALTAQAQPMHGGHGGPGGAGMMFGGGHIEHVLDSVDATDAQRAQIKTIMQAAMQDLKGQREAGRKLHEQGLALFGAPVVDANAVEALRQQMLAQHDQASKRMSQVMIDVSRVLTPEQRAKFVERMQKRQARMMQHMHGAPAATK
nr:Spy/CpxP family protein refolding chaperone [uncultured Roseateles sp.]